MHLLLALLFSLLPRAYHAVWFTTYLGLDWPKTVATDAQSTERQQADLCKQFDALQAAGINTILFQTRLRGTMACASTFEPYDPVFTGNAKQTPAYDPLAFAIQEAHRRGMELHAWLVTFPVCRYAQVKVLGQRSIVAQHPELCRKSKDQYFLDPGMPGTADYLSRLCADLAQRYDLDGIHLDYVRYPERTIPFDDSKTYLRYGKGRPFADWRRDNVSRVVHSIHDAVKAVKPWIKLSCSPIGKYADLARQSSGGWNARDAVYQDAVKWINEGWMDILFPMLYFDGENFYPFALDWLEQVKRGQVVPGLGLYKLSPLFGHFSLLSLMRQVNFTEQYGFSGYALFRSRFLTDNVQDNYSFFVHCNRLRCLPPAVPASSSYEPSAPIVRVERQGYALLFHVKMKDEHLRYNIYRLHEGKPLLITARQKTPVFRWRPSLPALLHETYLLTSYDRYGHESAPTYVNLSSSYSFASSQA